MAKAQHAVVIGGGVAGTSCAESLLAFAKLLRGAPAPRVTVVAPGATVGLGRALSGSARLREVLVHAQDATTWARDAGVRYVRATAVGLDIAARAVALSDGEVLHYDALCIATGAAPRVPPPLRGAGVRDRVHTVRDARSVRALRAAVASASTVLVVGNGGVALEAVHALRNVDVTWVFRDKHPGAAFFDRHAGAALLAARDTRDARGKPPPAPAASNADRVVAAAAAAAAAADLDAAPGAALGPFWEASGPLRGALRGEGSLALRAGCEVEALARDSSGALAATLSTGETLCCDLVLVGAGVSPSTDWATGSGLERAPCGGVSVSAGSMRASAARVFAAGDCAAVGGPARGRDWFQGRLWTQAAAAGGSAGRAIARALCADDGEDCGMEFELFAHATEFFGIKVAFLGRYAAQGLPNGYVMLEDGGASAFVRVVLYDGCMRGALLVGDAVDRAETYENLILDGLQVAQLGAALVDLDADVADYFD